MQTAHLRGRTTTHTHTQHPAKKGICVGRVLGASLEGFLEKGLLWGLQSKRVLRRFLRRVLRRGFPETPIGEYDPSGLHPIPIITHGAVPRKKVKEAFGEAVVQNVKMDSNIS